MLLHQTSAAASARVASTALKCLKKRISWFQEGIMCAGATTAATTTPAKTTPLVVPPVDAPAQSTRREEPSKAPYLEGLLQGLLASCQAVEARPLNTPVGSVSSPAQQRTQQPAEEVVVASTASDAAPSPASVGVRMESQLVFDSCWRRFRERNGMDFAAPREVVWLNGAPGSGKGVSTPHICKARGISRAVCVSSLLAAAPEARKFIDAGEMITDTVVCDVLLDALLLPASHGLSTDELNVVVDGFPRTAVQVDFVTLLQAKLRALHTKYMDTPIAPRFPRPSFKVVMLYVDEDTSISRQLQRAAAAQAHNRRAMDAGMGARSLREERPTDIAPERARKRYMIFRQHYPAILRLKQALPFHLIDATGGPADTQEQITQELRYQSGLDLNEDTYALIRHLPLAQDLTATARQQLVGRLEGYCQRQRPLFGRVLALLGSEVVPLLQRGALGGAAEYVTDDALFADHPTAVDMLLDVAADRGFQASYVRELMLAAPAGTDGQQQRLVPLHRFRFGFEQPGSRDAAALKALEIAARMTEAAAGGPRGAGAAAAAAAGAPGSSSAASGAAGCGAGALYGAAPAAAAATAAAGARAAAAASGALHGGITASFIPAHLDLESRLRSMQQQQQQQQQPSTAAGRHGSRQLAPAEADSRDALLLRMHCCTAPDTTTCGHAQPLDVLVSSGGAAASG